MTPPASAATRFVPRGTAWLALPLAAIIAWLAALQLRGFNGDVNPDGISYLELAKLFSTGDPAAVANGYWSPLYPLVLGIATRVGAVWPGAHPSEISIALATNLLIFALAALAITRLVRVLALAPSSQHSRGISALRAVVVAALCVWSLVRMVGVTTITPDALLAVLLFLVTADIAAVGDHPSTNRRALIFGVLLGLGYWTKAVFLPVSVAAIAAYAAAGGRTSWRRLSSRALIGLVVVAGPLVAVQSVSQHHLSFGESGRLNYRWYVGGFDHAPPVHEPVAETRLHSTPSTVALDAVPGSLLFNGDVAGSFPYWFDPSRFEPAGAGQVSLAAQWQTLRSNALWFALAGFNLLALGAIAFATARRRGTTRWNRCWAALPSFALLGLYALTNPTGRMGGAPIACIVAIIATLAVPEMASGRRVSLAFEYAALCLLTLILVGRTARRVPTAVVSSEEKSAALVEAVRSNGLETGSAVGVVGLPFGNYWAHLAGVRFVVVITPLDTTRVLDEAALESVAREAAERGQPISAVLWHRGARMQSPSARALADGWWIWRSAKSSTAMATEP
jgi:hypothetical protein